MIVPQSYLLPAHLFRDVFDSICSMIVAIIALLCVGLFPDINP